MQNEPNMVFIYVIYGIATELSIEEERRNDLRHPVSLGKLEKIWEEKSLAMI